MCWAQRTSKWSLRSLVGGHDVQSISPGRNAGRHRRQSTRHERRARKHLFVHVALGTPDNLQSSKTTFPNPSTSHARYTKSLFVNFPQVVAPADAEEGGWIPTFSGVVRLEMLIDCPRTFESLPLFHGFLPVIRSIHISSSNISSSHSLNLFYSFPLLEDLSAIGLSVDNGDTSHTQPAFI